MGLSLANNFSRIAYKSVISIIFDEKMKRRITEQRRMILFNTNASATDRKGEKKDNYTV